jgi:hypothetical protein
LHNLAQNWTARSDRDGIPSSTCAREGQFCAPAAALEIAPHATARNSLEFCANGPAGILKRADPANRHMAEALGIEDDRAATPRFLTVDERVPDAIRQLLEEADGCLNMNFAVGGTACIRRAIRKTFEVEEVEGGDFASSVRSLADKHQGIAPTLFQVVELLGGAEDPLHMDALRALIATFKSILYEVYVLGEERAESLAYISKLLQAVDRDGVSSKPSKPRTAAFPTRSKN